MKWIQVRNFFRRPTKFVTPEGETLTKTEWLEQPDSAVEYRRADLATKPVYRNGIRFEENITPGVEVDPGDYKEIEGF